MTVIATRVKQLDYLRLSSQYLVYGILLGLFRVFWIVGETSGLFGTPPDQWVIDASRGLELGLFAYTLAGALFFIEVVRRQQSAQNEPISPLIMSFFGMVLMLAFVERVDYAVHASPQGFLSWSQLFVQGIIRGGVYALVALGYTLVYGILFMINFAHGEVMMFGAYSGYFAMGYLTRSGTQSFESGAAEIAVILVPLAVGFLFLPIQNRAAGRESDRVITWTTLLVRFAFGFVVGYGALVGLGGYAPHIYLIVITIAGVVFAMLAGMTGSMLLSIGLERLAYRPLRRAPRLIPLISAIGASIFLREVANRTFGEVSKVYPRIDLINANPNFYIGMGELGRLPISKMGLIIVITSLLLMVVLYIIVQRTKMGKAMRAVAEDKDTAALMGINVDRVIVFTFMLGASLAGAAGVMSALRGDQLSSGFGFTPGLKAFTAAVVGGIGNIPGAMIGGFFLGVVEALGPSLLGINSQWQNAISFSLLVVVLVFRPQGLLGEVVSAKKV